MKVTLTFLIICFLAMGSFLIGIGCSSKAAPSSVQQPTPDMRKSADQLMLSADSEKEPLEALDEKEPLEGYMTAAESKRWLQNNHYQVQKEADGNGYIITRDYYDLSTTSYYDLSTISSGNARLVIGDSSPVEVGKVLMTTDKNGEIPVEVRKVLMTTDKNGEIRVKVTGAEQ